MVFFAPVMTLPYVARRINHRRKGASLIRQGADLNAHFFDDKLCRIESEQAIGIQPVLRAVLVNEASAVEAKSTASARS